MNDLEIIVRKSKRTLELWRAGKLAKTYPIAIGKSEFGHKQVEGDMKTPEGEYFVCVKNPKSKYHLSLGINYPNSLDAEMGLKEGRISEEEYRNICKAEQSQQTPPWKTPLGGEIFIHGNLEKKNWSEGCVRMFDKDIEELYALASVGTKVKILA